MFKISILLLTLLLLRSRLASADPHENEVDSGDGFENVVQNFLASESGQELGKQLFNFGANSNANQMLDGIGSMLGNGKIDPSILTSALGLLLSNANQNQKDLSILPWIIELFGKEGGAENLMNFIPTILSSINSFVNVDGDKDDHSGHDWLLPPIVEKLHVLINNLLNSDMGKMVISVVKSSKIYKMLSDSKGNIDFEKLFSLLENHSFRKLGIETVTKKVGEALARALDPALRDSILMILQSNFNSLLRDQGFPKNAVLDPKNPIDSLSAIINYGVKKSMGYQIRSKQYVKPAFLYLKDIYNTLQLKGYLSGKKLNPEDLSNSLADIINLEIIEPFARVFRAYRFVKKHKKCDKYVMCMVNKDISDNNVNLPKIKILLTKVGSLISSWFISNHTGTSFWTLYSYVMDNANCKSVHFKSCDGFHEEEIKVTTEYVHSEL